MLNQNSHLAIRVMPTSFGNEQDCFKQRSASPVRMGANEANQSHASFEKVS